MTPDAGSTSILLDSHDPDVPRSGPRTLWLFGLLVVASLAVAYYANTAVLTENVYRALLAEEGAVVGADAVLAESERWTTIGYVLNPVSLAIRIGVAALLVQLGLLAFRIRAPLRRVFRAGVWAQWALWFGSAVRVFWLGLLPEAARTAERLEAVPGSGEWLVSGLGTFDTAIPGLLRQLSLYQIGWVALFVLALEHRDRIPIGPAAVVVSGVWILSVLARWGVWAYLGLGGLR